MEQDRGTAQVHWLVAGRFGLGQRGRTITLTRADFNEALEKAKIEVRATIPDTIGAGETRTVALKVDSLKVFSLKHVISAVSDLGELLSKAEKVSKLKDPSMSELEGILGRGKLLDQLKDILHPQQPSEPAKTAETKSSGNVDEILSKGAVQEKTAKSAIDMFIRGTARAAQSKPKPAARQLRDAIEGAAYGGAAAVLRAPEVQAVETAWRGLRLLVSECPKDSAMVVHVLESDPEHVLEDLAARERGDDIDEPDCIFVVHDFDKTEPLAELADFAEQELMPVVVGVSPSLFGADNPQKLPDAFEALERAKKEDVPEWAARWDELRMKDATRWLCAVINRVVVHTEGAGEAKRTVFASGVWGVAAMTAASYRTSGGFARIFGKNGSLRAPASHTIESGPYKDTAAPTEAFYAITPAEVLARNGLLGLSSARNSDALTLSKAPVVRGAPDAVPLPAQILTGRVVRFANWVKVQLPEGCDSQTANDIFTSAASVFLFPGQDEAAHVRAATTNIDGEAHVVVRAAANPKIASIPFEIAFPLPLGWSVPAPEGASNVENPVAAAQKSAGKVAEFGSDQKMPEKGGANLQGGSVGFDVGLTKKDD